MKTQSNIAFPKSARWKEGEMVVFVNHKDNGVQPEGDEGKRYEADFTIVKTTNDITDVVDAFTRMTIDPVQDRLVVDNIEIDGVKAIDAKKDYPTKVSSTIFPPLPSSGALKKGEVYSYNNGAVMVVQDHNRTIYTPEQTPALFSFYRDNTTDLEWMEGEKVEVGWTRMYEGKKYECLQAHQTLSTWTPDVTPALWKEIVVVVDIPVWVQPTGAHDAYNIGDKVHFPTITDPVYESLINANVWSPIVYAAGWRKL
jgi:hypothetical protein